MSKVSSACPVGMKMVGMGLIIFCKNNDRLQITMIIMAMMPMAKNLIVAKLCSGPQPSLLDSGLRKTDDDL